MREATLEQVADLAYAKLCDHHAGCIACQDASGDTEYMCEAGAEIFRRWHRAEYAAGMAAAGEYEVTL